MRQFSEHYVVRRDGGADRPVPTATQVMNALRAESALDEKLGAGEMKTVGISACGKAITHVNRNKSHHGMAKRNRVGGGGANIQNKGKPCGRLEKKKGDKQETQTCYRCGEVGHLRPNCPNRENSSDDGIASSSNISYERKRWQNKPVHQGDTKIKKVNAVGCFPHELLIVCSVVDTDERTVEWALDSASDVHVCNRRDLLALLQHDYAHVFQGYEGTEFDTNKVGSVQLQLSNDKHLRQDVMLKMRNVLCKRSSPDNLLSLDQLEHDGWQIYIGCRDSQRVCWMVKGRLHLLLVKSWKISLEDDRTHGLTRTCVRQRCHSHKTSFHAESSLTR